MYHSVRNGSELIAGKQLYTSIMCQISYQLSLPSSSVRKSCTGLHVKAGTFIMGPSFLEVR